MLFSKTIIVPYISAKIQVFTQSQSIQICDIIGYGNSSMRRNFNLGKSIQMTMVHTWWQRHCQRRSEAQGTCQRLADMYMTSCVRVMRSPCLGWRGRLLGCGPAQSGPIPWRPNLTPLWNRILVRFRLGVRLWFGEIIKKEFGDLIVYKKALLV